MCPRNPFLQLTRSQRGIPEQECPGLFPRQRHPRRAAPRGGWEATHYRRSLRPRRRRHGTKSGSAETISGRRGTALRGQRGEGPPWSMGGVVHRRTLAGKLAHETSTCARAPQRAAGQCLGAARDCKMRPGRKCASPLVQAIPTNVVYHRPSTLPTGRATNFRGLTPGRVRGKFTIPTPAARNTRPRRQSKHVGHPCAQNDSRKPPRHRPAAPRPGHQTNQ